MTRAEILRRLKFARTELDECIGYLELPKPEQASTGVAERIPESPAAEPARDAAQFRGTPVVAKWKKTCCVCNQPIEVGASALLHDKQIAHCGCGAPWPRKRQRGES